MTYRQLELAGEFIRDSVSTERPSDPLGHVRFTDALTRHTARTKRNRTLAAVGSTCLVGIAALVTSAAMQPKVLTYSLEASSELGTVGSYMSAPAQTPLSLRFSEGSRVVLQPKARGRVANTSRHGATMVLENGHAHAEIVHRDDTDWRVLAGPFVVGVKGTSFDVGFDVVTQTFDLKMQSGAVKVTGPGLSQPIEVRGDQRLVLSAKGGEPLAQPPQAEAPPLKQVPASSTCDREPSNARPSDEGLPAAHRVRATETETDSFAQLGARGQHQYIVELAEKRGLDATMMASNRADLMALGNAARFAGRANVAVSAYRTVRERFAKTSDAATAAFFLGRLHESSPSQGISWYERYVAEAPSGVWVAEALGRRLALLNESQPGPTARAAAKDYLERFPSGPYAGFARKLLTP